MWKKVFGSFGRLVISKRGKFLFGYLFLYKSGCFEMRDGAFRTGLGYMFSLDNLC